MNRRLAPRTLTFACALVLLTGCASGSETAGGANDRPTPSVSTTAAPTKSPAPSVTSEPIPDTAIDSEEPYDDEDGSGVSPMEPSQPAAPDSTIVFGATRLQVLDAGGTTTTVADYDDTAATLAAIVAKLGAPSSTKHDTQCGYDIAWWSGFGTGAPLEVWSQFATSPGGPPTIIYVNVPRIGNTALRSSAGLAVGDSVTAYASTLPSNRVDPRTGRILWETNPDAPTTGGIVMRGSADRVGSLITPGAFDSSMTAACWN